MIKFELLNLIHVHVTLQNVLYLIIYSFVSLFTCFSLVAGIGSTGVPTEKSSVIKRQLDSKPVIVNHPSTLFPFLEIKRDNRSLRIYKI